MGTTLAQLIDGIRNRHPAFHRTRVTNRTLAAFLSDLQRDLITKGADYDANRVAIACCIAFATSPNNLPGAVGAGTSGGLPADPEGAAVFTPGEGVGAAVELNTGITAQVLVADTVVSVATALDVTLVGAAWIVNQFANQVALVTAGQGYAQRRTIISNTANKLVISTGADGQQWQTVPNATSMVRVVLTDLEVDEMVSVVTQIPPKTVKRGYLISIDAQGHPYINLSAPLEVMVDAGIPLPPYERVIGGSVNFTGTSGLSPLTAPLSIRVFAQRYLWGPNPTCWLENEKLFLAGALSDWTSVLSVDLRLVPVGDDFEAMTDYMVLPDLAKPALIAHGAAYAAQRCASDPSAPTINTDWFEKRATQAEEQFLQAIGGSNRAHAVHVKEVW